MNTYGKTSETWKNIRNMEKPSQGGKTCGEEWDSPARQIPVGCSRWAGAASPAEPRCARSPLIPPGTRMWRGAIPARTDPPGSPSVPGQGAPGPHVRSVPAPEAGAGGIPRWAPIPARCALIPPGLLGFPPRCAPIRWGHPGREGPPEGWAVPVSPERGHPGAVSALRVSPATIW